MAIASFHFKSPADAVPFFSIANKGSDTGQSTQYTSHRKMHFISSSLLNISQQPSSLHGTVQFVMVLEFKFLTHPNTRLYESSIPFSSICASCFVSNLRCSFEKVNPRDPSRQSGFSMSLQMVKFGGDGGMTSGAAELLFVVATNPPAMAAAAATTLTDTATAVVELDASIPNGPTGTTAAAPPAFTPDAHDATAFCDAASAI